MKLPKISNFCKHTNSWWALTFKWLLTILLFFFSHSLMHFFWEAMPDFGNLRCLFYSFDVLMNIFLVCITCLTLKLILQSKLNEWFLYDGNFGVQWVKPYIQHEIMPEVLTIANLQQILNRIWTCTKSKIKLSNTYLFTAVPFLILAVVFVIVFTMFCWLLNFCWFILLYLLP